MNIEQPMTLLQRWWRASNRLYGIDTGRYFACYDDNGIFQGEIQFA